MSLLRAQLRRRIVQIRLFRGMFVVLHACQLRSSTGIVLMDGLSCLPHCCPLLEGCLGRGSPKNEGRAEDGNQTAQLTQKSLNPAPDCKGSAIMAKSCLDLSHSDFCSSEICLFDPKPQLTHPTAFSSWFFYHSSEKDRLGNVEMFLFDISAS